MLIFNTHLTGSPAADHSVTLPFDKRGRGRLRIALDGQDGDAGIDIERGHVLRDGDRLGNSDGLVLVVHAEAESVSVASTDDERLFARACYHVGNRHAQVQIGNRELIYLHDHVLDEMLAKLGLSVASEKRPFDPENGAYAGGHSHSHSHSHSHEHEHEHEHEHTSMNSLVAD